MKGAIVTGVAGGIGDAIGRHLRKEGWFIVGLDQNPPKSDACDQAILFDLRCVRDSERFRLECVEPLSEALDGRPLAGLVNNAALQILSPIEKIELADWDDSFLINVTAPMLLVQTFLDLLQAASGCVVNIGSVHARATKSEFVTYATTKAALHGLTRALAVDLGSRARVACLAPAAISTPMLLDGFAGNEQALASLEHYHPVGRIGKPQEVAKAVSFLLSDEAGFLTGSTLYLDGGILCRLHDPA